MNYIRQYAKLIETRLNRPLLPGVYYEKHHIIPRCMCESKAVVSLTYREHVFAHHLLFKIMLKVYGLKHKYTLKTGYALRCMVGLKNDQHKRELPSKDVAKVVRSLTKFKKVFSHQVPHNKGKNASESTRQKQREAHLRRSPPTEETKQKISDAMTGKQRSTEHCKKLSESHKGKILSEDHREKLSKAKSPKLFSFIRETTQEIAQNVTAKDFMLKHPEINKGALYAMIRGEQLYHKGWKLA